MRARRLKKAWKANPCEQTWEEFRAARNYKGTLIKKALRQAYRTKVAEACASEKCMWQFSCWSRNKIARRPPIPAIEGKTDPKLKAQKFVAKFSRPLSNASTADMNNYTYPESIKTHSCITEHKIQNTILTAPAKKCPGSDGIPHEILKLALEPLLPHFHRILNACFTMGYYPSHFKTSVTVALRKPAGERDYTQVKSYRSIALLNTMGKIFETIMAHRLSYMTEVHQLLPTTHFGGRKVSSTEHAGHHLLERIQKAWNTKNIASLLLLDAAGAFDNVVHERLLHNLRKKGLMSK